MGQCGRGLYGWYYDTQAMFNTQGVMWDRWNRKFQKELIRNLDPEGAWSATIHGDEKLLATTLSCLQLEVYYRYFPTMTIFSGKADRKMAKKPKKLVDDDDELENLIMP
jgi:hypothetical protein